MLVAPGCARRAFRNRPSPAVDFRVSFRKLDKMTRSHLIEFKCPKRIYYLQAKK
jgi:hypothetical protein